tara:strand:+ start:185 stop:508 length:324 start_codon:yes stop_codon:yes gene_type:complete
MSVTKTWQINTLERDVSDGYVTTIIYRVLGIDDNDNLEKYRITGQVQFTKPSSLPSDFKAYDSLDADTCLGWLKTSLGTAAVNSIESDIEAKVNLIVTPVKATGKPW